MIKQHNMRDKKYFIPIIRDVKIKSKYTVKDW